VHIGQDDVTSMKARRMLGPSKLLGVSTHNTAQLRVAAAVGAADYLAIGPVYATASKENLDPVVGLEGVRAARALTALPLVAIGGITGEKAREVLDAGADSVAVISALLPRAGSLPELDMKQTVSQLLSYLTNSQAD
jgi:thiamine-phosphate pyrophosphorylase